MKTLVIALMASVVPMWGVAQTPSFNQEVDLHGVYNSLSSVITYEHVLASPMVINGVAGVGTYADGLFFPEAANGFIETSILLPSNIQLSMTPTVGLEFAWWKGTSDGLTWERLTLEVRIRGESTYCNAYVNNADFYSSLNVLKGAAFTLPMACTSVGAGPNVLWFRMSRGWGQSLGHGNSYLLGASVNVTP